MAFQPMPPLSSLRKNHGRDQNKNKNNKKTAFFLQKQDATKTKIKIDDGEPRRKIKLPKNGRGAPMCQHDAWQSQHN